MTRPLGLFLAGVVLPVLLAVAGAVVLREQEALGLQEDASARIARISGALLLGEASRDSAAVETDPPTGEETEVLPTRDRARATLRAVQRMTGYRIAVYLDEERAWASDLGFGPDTLPSGAGAAVDRGERPGGLDVGETAAAVGLAGGPGTPSLVVLAAPMVPRSTSLPLSNLLPVLTVALILSVVAAWVLFRPPSHDPSSTRGSAPGRIQTGLVVLIPVLAGWALLGYLRRDLNELARELVVRELSRSGALVRDRIPEAPVEEILAVTGFHATRIEDGRVLASTLDSDRLRGELARTPSPPRGFTSTGRVRAGREAAVYTAFRSSGRGILVLTSPHPHPRARLYSAILWFLAVVIALPGAVALLSGRLLEGDAADGPEVAPLLRDEVAEGDSTLAREPT